MIEPAARSHLVQVNLRDLGVADYGELQDMTAVDFGSPTHYLPAPLELAVDGRSMTLARWPNVVGDPVNVRRGFIDHVRPLCAYETNTTKTKDYAAVRFKDVMPLHPGTDVTGTPFHLAPERLARWHAPHDAWFAGGVGAHLRLHPASRRFL